jgi:hypothetical protein
MATWGQALLFLNRHPLIGEFISPLIITAIGAAVGRWSAACTWCPGRRRCRHTVVVALTVRRTNFPLNQTAV